MILPHCARALPFILVVLLGACGGGGGVGLASSGNGGGGGGIGGTGHSSSGTIDGFGSIFVNGVEFETDDALIELDGNTAAEGELGLGMVVLVTGTVNDDGVTGKAAMVVFDDAVEGPVQSIQSDADGDSLLVTILGVEVIVERTSTVFEGTSFATLALGDQLEVSGFPNASGQYRATRVEKKGDFVAGQSRIELKGTVAQLTATEFSLGTNRVDYSNADLSDLPGGALTEGMRVEVHGTLVNGVITASQVQVEDGAEGAYEENEDVSVQGTITGFVDSGDFLVGGVRVDARNAELQPSGLVLANGQIVEAEGRWQGGVLRASELQARRGRIEIEAKVGSVDAAAGTVTLQLSGGKVTVRLDARTLLEDDTGVAKPMRIGDIRTGDFLEVEATDTGNTLLATRIDRDDVDDDVVQAPVESFVAGSSITVLGIVYSTEGAVFKGRDDVTVTPAAFYGALDQGMLVKIKDKKPADGVADKVELESDADLDGAA